MPTNDRAITGLRNHLLELHQVLLNYEREMFERERGRVKSPRSFWDMVINDPQFSWLHGLSELIVGIDGMLDSDIPVDQKNIRSLSAYTKKLLTPSKSGTVFSKNYYRAIQHEPTVALEHGKIMHFMTEHFRSRAS